MLYRERYPSSQSGRSDRVSGSYLEHGPFGFFCMASTRVSCSASLLLAKHTVFEGQAAAAARLVEVDMPTLLITEINEFQKGEGFVDAG